MSDTYQYPELEGPRFEIGIDSDAYPSILLGAPDAPEKIYGIGDPAAIKLGISITGARKDTPYGRACARRFAEHAAKLGMTFVSGGARGIETEVLTAAVDRGCPAVVVLGTGADVSYPTCNRNLFQKVIDSGGVVISEQAWGSSALRHPFMTRRRIIAQLAALVLIVEAGRPSMTYGLADYALRANHDVAAVPGPITSSASEGTNQLILDGAQMIVDETSLAAAISIAFAALEAR